MHKLLANGGRTYLVETTRQKANSTKKRQLIHTFLTAKVSLLFRLTNIKFFKTNR